MSSFDSSALPEFLHQYYKRLFPFKPYVKWLVYGKKLSEYFALREFAFILQDDVYLRYRSFNDTAEFEKEVQKIRPYKIDVGPICSHRPKDHKTVRDFTAKERELVFDIDLTDYDDVRTCCKGGDMCAHCWKFMVLAIRILDRALKEDFGFDHRLWVYSGRRGVHCWVCDEVARKLTSEGRSAVAEYLTLVVGGEQQKKKVNLPRNAPFLHPSITAALAVIEADGSAYLKSIAVDQGWFDNPDRWAQILALVPDEDLRNKIDTSFKELEAAGSRFQALSIHLKNFEERNGVPKHMKWTLEEILLQLVYPRLDINVTKGLNHLLKSPFCVHPKTGKVAVPLNADNVHLFNPDQVPRIDQLLYELSEMQEQDGDQENANRRQLQYKRTSLGDYVMIFERFVERLCEKQDNKLRAQADTDF